MNSWPITPIAAPRATRATSGTVATTSAITTAAGPARHPRHVGHGGDHQRDDDGGEAGAEDRGDGEPDQDGGEGQHHVDQPHDPAVQPPIIGGKDAEHSADQPTDDHADQPEHQRVARSVDDAAQDVAAGIVGTEPVLGAGRLHHLGKIGEVGIVRRDQWCKHCREHDCGKHQRGHGSDPIPRQPAQHAGTGEHAGFLIPDEALLECLDAHLRLTLGSR
jgi:hypothetical protein